MQEKDKSIKKQNSFSFFLIIFFAILFLKDASAAKTNLKIENYFNNLNLFSSKFIQSSGTSLEEGYIYIDNGKIRLDYFNPDRTIKISRDKGVYINHELKEEEFFSTKENLIGVFYDVFLGENFFSSLSFKENKKEIIFKKNIKTVSDNTDLIIFFENDPVLIRKITAKTKDSTTSISFSEHTYYNTFDKSFFSFVPIYLDWKF